MPLKITDSNLVEHDVLVYNDLDPACFECFSSSGKLVPTVIVDGVTIVGNGASVPLSIVGGAGEANTASNVGAIGTGIFKQKTGINFEFKKIVAGSSNIIIGPSGADLVVIDVNQANLSLISTQITDFVEAAQDAIGLMIDSTLTYVDGTPLLQVTPNTTVQKVAVRKNSSGGDIGTRRRINFIEGTNITLTIADDAGNDELDITIDAAGGTGEVNTASNVGIGGQGLFKQKTGVDLEFKKLIAASNKILIGTSGADLISIDVDQSNITLPSINITDFVEAAQDAIGLMIDSTLTYVDGTPLLQVTPNTTVQKVAVRKNSSGGDIGTRRRINFIEGTNITLTIADDAGNDELDITIDAAGGGGGGSGDVVGPASATDNAVTRFDTGTGKLIQNSNAILEDTGRLNLIDATQSQLVLSGWDSRTGVPEVSTFNGELQLGVFAASCGRIHYNGASLGHLLIDNTYDDDDADIRIRSRTSGTAVTLMTLQGDSRSAINALSAVGQFDIQTRDATTVGLRVLGNNSATVPLIEAYRGASVVFSVDHLGAVVAPEFNGVPLTDAGSPGSFLNEAGAYVTIPAAITCVFDGQGSALVVGSKVYLEVPFGMTITGWTILAEVSGSVVIDIWKDTYANFPPVVGDSIAGSEKPTLSSAQKNQDLTLTTWTTTTVNAGDTLIFNVDSATTVTKVTVVLRGVKT